MITLNLKSIHNPLANVLQSSFFESNSALLQNVRSVEKLLKAIYAKAQEEMAHRKVSSTQ